MTETEICYEVVWRDVCLLAVMYALFHITTCRQFPLLDRFLGPEWGHGVA